MSHPNESVRSDTRRDFLRGAGVVAGSAAVLATGLTVDAQDTKTAAPPPPAPTKSTPAAGTADAPAPAGKRPDRRASVPMKKILDQLGPLREMPGTWVGHGFNTVSLPDFDNPSGAQPFRVKLSATREILEFTKIGGNVPNRGSDGQLDINLFGLSYFQRITDALSNEPLHLEPGFWLRVPETKVPFQPETVVRMGSIPHGTTILAQGFSGTFPSGPKFDPADITPISIKTNVPITNPVYLAPFSAATLPPGFHPTFLKNPNLALEADILGQEIIETTVLTISTSAKPDKQILAGNIGNIPFVDSNAKVTSLDATFWIEKVKQSDEHVFMQLQYTQKIILDFREIHWPHISVATLLKQ
jgi:hypothetical protein